MLNRTKNKVIATVITGLIGLFLFNIITKPSSNASVNQIDLEREVIIEPGPSQNLKPDCNKSKTNQINNFSDDKIDLNNIDDGE